MFLIFLFLIIIILCIFLKKKEGGFSFKEICAKFEKENEIADFGLSIIENGKITSYNEKKYCFASISKLIFSLIVYESGENFNKPLVEYDLLPELNIPEDVTFLMLLKHKSGADTEGYFGYEKSLETTPGVYNGESLLEICKKVKFSESRDLKYSGGGYCIAQLFFERYFKDSLENLANKFLFNKLGVDLTFDNHDTVPGYRINNEGKLLIFNNFHPTAAASGISGTTENMAKIILYICKLLKEKPEVKDLLSFRYLNETDPNVFGNGGHNPGIRSLIRGFINEESGYVYVFNKTYRTDIELKRKIEEISYIKKIKDLEKTELLFVVGYGGAGKSTYADKISKNVVHTDEIIRNNLPDEGFDLYQRDIDPNNKLINKFIDLIQNEIKKNNLVIEGQIKNLDLINKIAGDLPYKIIVVAPKNQESYERNLMGRFIENPKEYGRIGIIKILDKDGKILEEYLKNKDINIIKELIHNAANERYGKHIETINYYKSTFKNVEIVYT